MPRGNFTEEWITVKCGFCSKEIKLSKGQYQQRIKRSKTGLLFCSNECRTNYRSSQDIRETRLICYYCNKDFTYELDKYEYNRRVKTLNKFGKVFCCREHAAIFMDTDPEIRRKVADKERGVPAPQRGRTGHTVPEDVRQKIGDANRVYRDQEGKAILELKCVYCGKIFHRKRWVHNQLMKQNKGRGPFCSRQHAQMERPVSDEQRKKASVTQIGISRPQSGRTGHPMSDEARLNISMANTGVPKKADWEIVDDAMKRLGINEYFLFRAPVPDSAFIYGCTCGTAKIGVVEVEKKRWETEIRRKMKSYEKYMTKFGKVIIMWYNPQSQFIKRWDSDNHSWRSVN